MKKIYEAFDGTEFETKEECKQYENLHLYESLEMLDKKYLSTTNFDDAYFIIVRNDLDKQRMKNLLDDYGYEYDDIETIPTVFAWNNDLEIWEDLIVEAERLKEKLTKLKEILSMIGEDEEC